MDAYCVQEQRPISTLYDQLADWDEEDNINSMLNYIQSNTVNFHLTTDLSQSLRPEGYLHLLAKNLSLEEYIAVSTNLKERLVYVFQNESELIMCCFNSYDTQADLQTERIVYSFDANRQPRVAFKELGGCAYLYYCVAKVTTKNSLNCYMKATSMVCPEFLASFQDKIAQSTVYAVGTYGFANGGKRMALRKNDGTFELVQLNLSASDKIYTYGDFDKFN